MTAIARLVDVSGHPDWEVGAACGIHPSTLSRYRSGERVPHARHVVRLCEYLNVTEAMLLGDEADLPYERTIRVAEVPGPRNLLPAGMDDPAEWIE
jgi:transcriptional regulator with XRE-family HTH domain